ncbi:PH domain-containing protein [Nocardiopsis sp. CNT-189]|uniref:PH domain-containing protein n=1 Tax=Nocardiopsis oceanisediminis TaxID=2816862 RepID=UPI003B3A1DF3
MDDTVNAAVNAAAPTAAAHPGAAAPADSEWRRLSPFTVRVSLLAVTLFFVLPGLAGAGTTAFFGAFWPWGALILLAAALLTLTIGGGEVFRYRLTRYRVTEERMEMRSGVIARSHRSLPRDRIRTVDVAASLWARPFGLCRVTVGSGQSGDPGDELTLDLVTAEEGQRLRRELLRRSAGAPAAAEARPEGAAADAAGRAGEGEPVVLAALAPRWFRYGALSWGPMALGYGALAALAGTTAQIIGDFASELFVPIGMGLYEFVVSTALVTVPAALLGVVAFGTAVALAVHVEAWWGYRLTREPDGTLLVKRGLLNLSSVSIEERRLRGVELCEYLPLRWFGAASVAAVASGLGEDQQSKGLVPKRTLSPDMPRAEAVRTAGDVLPGAGFPELARHPRAALRRRLFRAAAATAVLTAAAGAPLWLVPAVPADAAAGGTAAAAALSALLCAPYAVGAYRGLGHGLDRRLLYLRGGMAARSTVALKREAVIGWTVTRSPLQRRAGLSTLGATVAADSGVHKARDIGHGQGLALADEAVPGLLAPFLIRD